MTEGSWFDTIGLAVVGLICLAVVGRHLLGLFRKSPTAACGGCSKCGGAQRPDCP